MPCAWVKTGVEFCSCCCAVFSWLTFFCHVPPAVKQRVELRLEQMGRPLGVRLHTAHVLCMDAILNVGLEMGSHNQDCWPHVFRYAAPPSATFQPQWRHLVCRYPFDAPGTTIPSVERIFNAMNKELSQSWGK